MAAICVRTVISRTALLAALCTAACTDPAEPGEPDPDEPAPDGDPGATDDPQLPPRGHAALTSWLAAGHYKAWACEPAPHPARPQGAHGENRICSNAALSASASGAYPIGAASVKELYRNGAIAGYAVGVKIAAPAAGSSWYWYEAVGSSVIADAVDRPLCSGCHQGAPRDFVFTHVR
jgi:hypothetical protein